MALILLAGVETNTDKTISLLLEPQHFRTHRKLYILHLFNRPRRSRSFLSMVVRMSEAGSSSNRSFAIGVIALLVFLDDVTHRRCSECECHFHLLEELCCKLDGYKSSRKAQRYPHSSVRNSNLYFPGTFTNLAMIPLSFNVIFLPSIASWNAQLADAAL